MVHAQTTLRNNGVGAPEGVDSVGVPSSLDGKAPRTLSGDHSHLNDSPRSPVSRLPADDRGDLPGKPPSARIDPDIINVDTLSDPAHATELLSKPRG